MRTKKLLIVVTALVALLAIGSATVATAKLKKIKKTSTITLSVSVTPGNPPYNQGAGTYSGTVSCGGPTGCRAGRLVTVFRNGTALGQVHTLSNGSYSLVLSSPPPRPGTYVSTVQKKKVVKKKKNKLFICKGATSNTVVVP
jgi:hypothetical protein